MSLNKTPGLCRCCGNMKNCRLLNVEYECLGIKEIFSDMLMDCFGLLLSHLDGEPTDRLVCMTCIVQLREACCFRRQVLRCEEAFLQMKINDNDGESCLQNGLQDTNKGLPKMRMKQKSNKRRKKISKTKVKLRQKLESDLENDSDTPIAELNNIETLILDNEPSETANKTAFQTDVNITKKQRIECGVTLGNDFKGCTNMIYNGTATPNSKSGMKQISERQKIILTCQIVLKYTTACPFRHHKSWFQCFYCLEEYMEVQLLRKHTLQHHTDVETELKKLKRFPRSLQIDISDLKCIQCSISLVNIDNMKTHLEEHHFKVIYTECIADYKVDKSPYVCHLCKIEFHVFRSLTTHLNDHYTNCICDICGKSFLNSKRLKVHKRTHENGLFPCSECGKVLKTKTSKANHMETHAKRVLKCQICCKPMKHYNDRIKHMSEAHNITHKFKCPICPREYNIKHYLATHIRQTHGSKNKHCAECNMAFITNHGLKKHMTKHTGEKPYVCNVCSKAYARSYTLKEHLRTHDDGKYTSAK